MLLLVVITGFLDGIHPCAIAILLFFIFFLLSLDRTLKSISLLGSAYIIIIFLTYLGVGVGLLSGITLLGEHYFFAKLGAGLLIVIGLANLQAYLFPSSPFTLRLPRVPAERIRAVLKGASLPTVIGGAFLVGLCSIPCSGGIYAAITALLAARTTYWLGFAYLLLYNLMFVSPLIVILALASNPITLRRLGHWQARNSRTYRLATAVLTFVLGVGILAFLA